MPRHVCAARPVAVPIAVAGLLAPPERGDRHAARRIRRGPHPGRRAPIGLFRRTRRSESRSRAG